MTVGLLIALGVAIVAGFIGCVVAIGCIIEDVDD